jgi:hypothetical protein
MGREVKRGEEKGRLTTPFKLRSRNYEVGIKPTVFQLRSRNNAVP